jgi:beta-carotene 3-hydroxylase
VEALTFAFIFFAVFAGMEGLAWLMHKYVMHGPLWALHGSHHRPRQGLFEANDLFGLFFAVPSIIFIYYGTHGYPPLLAVGLGMTAYGAAYFGFHDVVVHRRVSHRYRPASRYMQRIVRAHLVHHKTTTKDGAASFGFLYAAPFEQGDAASHPPDPPLRAPSESGRSASFGLPPRLQASHPVRTEEQ